LDGESELLGTVSGATLRGRDYHSVRRGAYRVCDFSFAKSRTHHTAFSVSKIIPREEEENSAGSIEESQPFALLVRPDAAA
jgi:hypothetical protein